jgi:AraC-like DNA-binding protein
MSPLQYLQLIRVQHAMERLQKNRDSIAAIAAQCGFCDSNHLCKVFRKSTGLTPLAFRKQHF